VSAEELLHALYDALPEGFEITFNRSSLGEMLGLSRPGEEQPRRDLKTDEVAKVFGVTPGTVLAWLHEGVFGEEGTGWYKLGRRYFIRESAIQAVGKRSRGTNSRTLRLPRR
jgi:hypothetical protein